LSGLKVNASSSELSLCFTSLQYTLTIHANIGAPIALKAPGESGIMTEIQEPVSTSVSLKLSERKEKQF